MAVTAGYMTEEPRRELYRHMDAANVDLKGFTERFYKEICAGHLAPVLETLEYLRHETSVWFEITTLLIPGENDSEEELHAMTEWVVSRLGPDVPIHFTAFHPDYRMLDKTRTPPSTLTRARSIAIEKGIRYAYTGNVHDPKGGSTYCHRCGRTLVERDWYELGEWNLAAANAGSARRHAPASSRSVRAPGALGGFLCGCLASREASSEPDERDRLESQGRAEGDAVALGREIPPGRPPGDDGPDRRLNGEGGREHEHVQARVHSPRHVLRKAPHEDDVAQHTRGAEEPERDPEEPRRREEAESDGALDHLKCRRADRQDSFRRDSPPPDSLRDEADSEKSDRHRESESEEAARHIGPSEPRHVAKPGTRPEALDREIGPLLRDGEGSDTPEDPARIDLPEAADGLSQAYCLARFGIRRRADERRARLRP